MIAFPRSRELDKLDDSILDQAERVLRAVRAIDLDALERLVQTAHESSEQQIDDPHVTLPVSRQALRAVWMFRRSLNAVDADEEIQP